MMHLIAVALLLIPGMLMGKISWHESLPAGFSATVKIPVANVSILDSISVELTLEYPSAYHVDLDHLQSNLLRHSPWSAPPFKLLSAKTDISEKDASITQKILYELQPQFPGEHVITFLNISFLPKDAKEKAVEIISDLFEIKVINVATEDPHDISVGPLLRLSSTFPIDMSPENRKALLGLESDKKAAEYNVDVFEKNSFPWWMLIAGLALVLVILSMKENAKPTILKKEELIKQAEEIALDSLKNLESQELPRKEQFIPFYVELTDTAREFIEKKYQLKAPTLTTQEFLQEASQSPVFDDEMRERLSQFLISADRVKFAKYHPTEEECAQALQDAKGMILRDSNRNLKIS